MRAGQGDPRLPAWESESSLHYVWRLAKYMGKAVGDEPSLAEDMPHGLGRKGHENRINELKAQAHEALNEQARG